ncbi:MAG: ParA family protein [Bacteroidota bacterium]
MANIITISNSKGGVGKSTLTLNIYQYLTGLGASCAICDTDYQKSITELGKNIPFVEVDDLGNEDLPYKFILVDTPPYRAEETLRILGMSNFLLIPVKPSILDIRAAQSVIDDAIQSETPFSLVMNMVKPGTNFTSLIREKLESEGLPVLKTEVRDRIAYARSVLFSSLEEEQNQKANDEIADLTNEILVQLT